MKHNKSNKSGKKLENDCENLLIRYNIPYIKAKQSGIDFIIYPNNLDKIMYLDCKSINGQGTAIERTPHTVFKYKKKYNANLIHILEGKVNTPEIIREHCNHLCETKFLKLKELEQIVSNQKVEHLSNKFFN
tara:strand:+ start:282 stop:677 length:396 start_codon:yes stop_codon:yes gene_type:complete